VIYLNQDSLKFGNEDQQNKMAMRTVAILLGVLFINTPELLRGSIYSEYRSTTSAQCKQDQPVNRECVVNE
jgi:hypothetical protein